MFTLPAEAFKVKPEVACYSVTWLVATATAQSTEIILGSLSTGLS